MSKTVSNHVKIMSKPCQNIPSLLPGMFKKPVSELMFLSILVVQCCSLLISRNKSVHQCIKTGFIHRIK